MKIFISHANAGTGPYRFFHQETSQMTRPSDNAITTTTAKYRP
jgi:hypothetical protein